MVLGNQIELIRNYVDTVLISIGFPCLSSETAERPKLKLGIQVQFSVGLMPT